MIDTVVEVKEMSLINLITAYNNDIDLRKVLNKISFGTKMINPRLEMFWFINKIIMDLNIKPIYTDIEKVAQLCVENSELKNDLISWSREIVTVENVYAVNQVFIKMGLELVAINEWHDVKAKHFTKQLLAMRSDKQSLTKFQLYDFPEEAENTIENLFKISLNRYQHGDQTLFKMLLPYLQELHVLLDYEYENLARLIKDWIHDQELGSNLTLSMYNEVLALLPPVCAHVLSTVSLISTFFGMEVEDTVTFYIRGQYQLPVSNESFYIMNEWNTIYVDEANVLYSASSLEDRLALGHAIVRAFLYQTPLSMQRQIILRDNTLIATQDYMNGYVIQFAEDQHTIKNIHYYISKFKDIKRLGAGSFGYVYFTRRKTDGVAFIRKIARQNSESIEALKHEANMLMKIQRFHGSSDRACLPLICCFHSFEFNPISQEHEMLLRVVSTDVISFDKALMLDEDETHYLGNLSTLDKLNMTFEMIKAIQLIHSAGIAHRDLHPANIIIYDKKHLYLIDFGLACSDEKRCIKEFKGRRYIAPEMHGDSDEYVDLSTAMKCDWYSVGVFLSDLFQEDDDRKIEHYIRVLIEVMSEKYMSLTSHWIQNQVDELSYKLYGAGLRRSERLQSDRLFPVIENSSNDNNMIHLYSNENIA